jgi:hypothetical protein
MAADLGAQALSFIPSTSRHVLKIHRVGTLRMRELAVTQRMGSQETYEGGAGLAQRA